jgi:protein AFG1
MDIFFQSLPVPHKVRYHYHHFLLSIYSQVSPPRYISTSQL